MLHHRIMSRTPGQIHSEGWIDEGHETACDDRRCGDRVPFPAEMVLIWNHDASLPHRFGVLDASDAGYRIRLSTPVLAGTTGMVMSLLPCSARAARMGQAVMVAWCRAVDSDDGEQVEYEAGLRIF